MIKKLNHTSATTANMIYEVFQVSYRIEATLLNADYFPPLQITAEAIQKRETSFFGFWKADKLAAVIELDELKSISTTDICSLVVAPDYFRQGIALALLTFAVSYYPSSSIIVETGALNVPAITLYKRFGFKETGKYMTTVDIEKIKLKLNVI